MPQASKSEGLMLHKNFINGEWVLSTSGKTFENINPTSRLAFSLLPDCSINDVKSAIGAARAAQVGWAALLPAQRAEYLYTVIGIFERRQDDFVNALIEETGSTFGKAMFEFGLSLVAIREAVSLVSRELGEFLPSSVPGKTNMTMRQPAGVISVISPWNFPLYLSLRGYIYAIALGNTAVVKPSEDAPITGGIIMAEVFEEAGLPKGVVNIVTCSRNSVGEVGHELVSNPQIARVSFTGSTAVGKYIAVESAKNLKKAILEMGGKNSIIILDDANIDYAVDVAFFGSFLHQGQICMSADKIIVAKEIYSEFLEKFVNKVRMFEPLEPSNQMSVIGPIINDRQLDKIDSIVQDAVLQGAKIQCGGQKQGPYYQATVLTDVSDEMRIYREEIFGPVAVVMPAADEDEAVEIANDTEYGLCASIVSSDTVRASNLVPRIEVGMVHINDSPVHDEPHCPFGGLKSSGWFGRWGSKGAIDAFTDLKWVSVQGVPRVYPF